MAKQAKFSKQNKQILAGVIILVLIFVLPILLSYSGYYPPFVDKKVIYFLDSMVADIPLLPKTPKQVITKSLIRNQSLKNYQLVTDFNLETKKVKIAGLKIDQAVENAGSVDSKSSSKIEGEIVFLPNGKINIETIKLGKNLNFKIISVPENLGINVGKLSQKWYQINLANFQKDLGVTARNDQQIIDDVRGNFSKIQGNLIEKSVFSKVQSFKKVKINNKEFYEIKIALDEDYLKDLPVLGQGLKIKNPVLTLWIGKGNFILTKADLSGSLASQNENSLLANSEIKVSLNSELKRIGEVQNITPPNNTEEIKSPIDLSLKLQGSSEEASSLLAATQTAKDLGDNFLTVERLLSVIILLPKSI